MEAVPCSECAAESLLKPLIDDCEGGGILAEDFWLRHACWYAGVLQVEAMAQLGGIVMMDPEDQAAKKNFFFGGIEGCKFRRPVVPGDTLVSQHLS